MDYTTDIIYTGLCMSIHGVFGWIWGIYDTDGNDCLYICMRVCVF